MPHLDPVTIITLCILFGVLFFVVGVLAISNVKLWIEFRGLQNSTHQVQLVDPRAYMNGDGAPAVPVDDRELPNPVRMTPDEQAALGFFDDLEERLN